jgi:hypothetical protein
MTHKLLKSSKITAFERRGRGMKFLGERLESERRSRQKGFGPQDDAGKPGA